MSYQMICACKRIAADKPTVLSTLGELRDKERQEALIKRKGDGQYATTKR